MTTETILTDGDIRRIWNDALTFYEFARAIGQAVLQSPEIQALRKDAVSVRRDTLLSALGKLNSNPYNLTKSECIDVVREMFEEADAAMEQQI